MDEKIVHNGIEYESEIDLLEVLTLILEVRHLIETGYFLNIVENEK